jgi:hypothetical protein
LAACCPSWFDDLWITDATSVPCGMSRETVKRSDLAGHGYCASHLRFYWGLKLYLVCTGDGIPVMWCLANPKIGERDVLAALLDHNHHHLRDGQILLADKGFSETYRNGNLGQWIESVNQTLKTQLGLDTTADAPPQACSPASPNAYSPWPQPSGTTGPPASPTNDLIAHDH